MVTRAEKELLLKRLCRGLYRYPATSREDGLLLYHAAARLRDGAFNYISLESALSDAGLISQIPMNRVTLMSSGRSTTLSCGRYGTIEFVHTKKGPTELADQLVYDPRYHLWRASVALAQAAIPGKPVTTARTGSHATYNVGPGQTYLEPDTVPWGALQAGDVVNIYQRATPYRWKIGI